MVSSMPTSLPCSLCVAFGPTESASNALRKSNLQIVEETFEARIFRRLVAFDDCSRFEEILGGSGKALGVALCALFQERGEIGMHSEAAD